MRVIRTGRLIDGTGAQVQSNRYIHVDDGRIVQVAPRGDHTGTLVSR
jgi:N-acyl-D-aspartate/D-glutamate deacylase